MKVIVVLALAVNSLIAADATGKWAGTLTPSEGSLNSDSAYLVLKQEGAKLTGTAGSNANAQHPIQNGKVEDGNITFEVVPREGAIMKFALKQEGDEIKGEVRGERGAEVITGKLAVKRDQ